MRSNSIRLGVIGAGNMGEAILRGYLASGRADGPKASVYDLDTEKCRAMEKDFGVTVADSLEYLIDESDLLLVALKPNVCAHIFSEQFDRFSGKAVVSIAAGWGGERLKNALPASSRVL